jgi:hypothetical protein
MVHSISRESSRSVSYKKPEASSSNSFTAVQELVATPVTDNVINSSVFSDEAKQKFQSESELIRFVRKVQAYEQMPSPRQERIDFLKQQFQKSEGVQEYLNSVDVSLISRTMLSLKSI